MQRKIPWGRILRILFYLLLFLGFALLPYQAAADGIFRCPSTFLGLQCPGCGVTRAMTLLMKGRIPEAWQLNPIFTGFLFPAFTLTALQDLFVTLTGGKRSFAEYLLRMDFDGPGGAR